MLRFGIRWGGGGVLLGKIFAFQFKGAYFCRGDFEVVIFRVLGYVSMISRIIFHCILEISKSGSVKVNAWQNYIEMDKGLRCAQRRLAKISLEQLKDEGSRAHASLWAQKGYPTCTQTSLGILAAANFFRRDRL